MAGLSVLLESHKKQAAGRPGQIISKATLLHHCPKKASPAASASSFLQRCSLCHKELAEGTDIYMYRGDRAFCSVECRCRQIFMDEDAAAGNSSCAKGAAAVRRQAGGGGGFAF
ncbi:hypothetical protein ACP70R_027348 [Stipagrostis hirtigluma subsp. patula]